MHIRWNGLHLEIPEYWDVIVKDARHLILERDFKPILELRWQPVGSSKSSNAVEHIVSHFSSEAERHPEPELSDLLPANLASRFTVQSFDLDPSAKGSVMLLTCSGCATLILVRIYADSRTGVVEIPTILESLDCHPTSSELALWQIQDFRFRLPDGFNLETSSFRFGITTLLFRSVSSELELCRLAPASQHLQQNQFSALFHAFSSAQPEKQMAADPSTLKYTYTPKMIEYLWSRVRRKKVHQSASFVHFPLHDRILGYSIRSNRPIKSEIESMLEESYGIIQKEETAAATAHP